MRCWSGRERATGLDDFGPDDFHERLGLWLSEMDEDEDAVGLARLVLFGNAVRYASNRLRIADLLRRHPEIHDVPIERPVIVVGLPRSGTTNLVNLLAADQRFRSMPLWESYEPVPGSRGARRRRRCRPPLDPVPRDVGGHAGHGAARGGHAPHGARPHPRGARAPAAGLRLLQPGMGVPGAQVAGLPPVPRPDLRTTATCGPGCRSCSGAGRASAGCSSRRSTWSSSVR